MQAAAEYAYHPCSVCVYLLPPACLPTPRPRARTPGQAAVVVVCHVLLLRARDAVVVLRGRQAEGRGFGTVLRCTAGYPAAAFCCSANHAPHLQQAHCLLKGVGGAGCAEENRRV